MKQKTQKSVAKRFKTTKKKKMLHRTAGQDHFNTREGGKITRNKRSDKKVSKTQEKNLKQLMPYS